MDYIVLTAGSIVIFLSKLIQVSTHPQILKRESTFVCHLQRLINSTVYFFLTLSDHNELL